ncbi:hypothetical protein BCR35DRAFT_328701 [Leucosporidium creatinivorum]|uniref:Uncharacterized protein n=1 Tax=Leucosporidium creatinivorum TaxID=106004 RepID=A0A1Y2G222_9BASI|nr:hypothetical protein BCR35DRAFT_328701 [Leucosporidium creatinivorum]
MDSGLKWLVFTMVVLMCSFVVYLFLSSCMGPPLIRVMRSWLGAHHRATSVNTWDRGQGAGYRVPASSGFEFGRGGTEGYEMTSLGRDDEY